MTQIISFSIIVWIFIDRVKKLWERSNISSIITSIVALLFGLLIAFYYRLDICVALELAEENSFIGYILTGMAIMGGSSCINEILAKISNPFDDIEVVNYRDFIESEENSDAE